MGSNVLLVKNMVCDRCIHTVETILNKSSIEFQKVLLGEIHLAERLSDKQRASITSGLAKAGFELIENHMGALVEKIKQLVMRRARNEDSAHEKKLNLSNLLSEKLNYEYTYLSSLFSSVEGRTIENYFIEQRIERAKELIVYGQKTLSEIAFELDYSSTAHLSSQFKKVTGLSPSHFKEIGTAKRKALDKV